MIGLLEGSHKELVSHTRGRNLFDLGCIHKY